MNNNWVDFQSGCGTCKASTDYVQYYGSGGKKKVTKKKPRKQKGGMGQYEDVMGSQVMIPVGNSMDSANDMYPTEIMGDVTGAQMMDKNLGVAWATTGGAKPKNKKNNKKAKVEEMKKMHHHNKNKKNGMHHMRPKNKNRMHHKNKNGMHHNNKNGMHHKNKNGMHHKNKNGMHHNNKNGMHNQWEGLRVWGRQECQRDFMMLMPTV